MGTPRLFVQVGQRFEKLTVLDPDRRTGGGRRAALVRCDCGTERVVMIYALLDGRTKSCGCLQQRYESAFRGHPLYGTWYQMLRRCQNPASDSYDRYGRRGIKVCVRWQDFPAFVEDIERELGSRPDGCTLDRKDNDGDYAPGRVQWATRKAQQGNRWMSAATRARRDKVHLLWLKGYGPAKVAAALGIPRHVAQDDIEWLRELADRQALEQELAAARKRIVELEDLFGVPPMK